MLPSTHDIDVMLSGSWDEETNERGTAYAAGVEGWWERKVAIVKSPDYKLNVTTQIFNFVPGQTYQVQCGSIDGHCFIITEMSYQQ